MAARCFAVFCVCYSPIARPLSSASNKSTVTYKDKEEQTPQKTCAKKQGTTQEICHTSREAQCPKSCNKSSEKGFFIGVQGGLPNAFLDAFRHKSYKGVEKSTLFFLGYARTNMWRSWVGWRQHLELSFNHNPDVNFRYTCFAWIPQFIFPLGPAFFFGIGVGAGLRNRPVKNSGGRVMIHMPLSLGFKAPPVKVEIGLRHTCNGGLASPNYGTDYVGATVTYLW